VTRAPSDGQAEWARRPARPLLAGLSGGRNATVDIPELDPALRPDLERLKRELDVLEAARADGRTNTPPTASGP
jgi:hypothetical protein